MSNEKKNVIDEVNESKELQSVIELMLSKRFLMPGIFQPNAYLIDEEKIQKAWKRKKSYENALAKGVCLHNDFFFEGIASVLQGRDFTVSAKTRNELEMWEAEIVSIFPNESKKIIEIARTLGQYLEVMNRKSQGY